MSGNIAAVEVATRGYGVGVDEFVRITRRVRSVAPTAISADLPMSFDAHRDLWTFSDADGSTCEARIVIDAAEAVDGRDLLADDVTRFGAHAYLGVARHGLPNYFVAADRDAGRYVARCLRALRARHCTRIEVRKHAQAQFNRYIDLHLGRLNPTLQKRPTLDHFEFTHRDDRDETEDYRGPAVIIDAEGDRFEVEIHVLAVFQPIDNAIRWSGRVLPTPLLDSLHRTVNQPITITAGSNPEVPAVLIDHDPWGGSHILGSGASPYPFLLVDEPARLPTSS